VTTCACGSALLNVCLVLFERHGLGRTVIYFCTPPLDLGIPGGRSVGLRLTVELRSSSRARRARSLARSRKISAGMSGAAMA